MRSYLSQQNDNRVKSGTFKDKENRTRECAAL